ncbi:MAG TPA: hypothetical protein VJT71_07520 [Pyrinomonadaceae bacterium]|nr:hypothetical protein [Pyrinomonadaceae bacterium]
MITGYNTDVEHNGVTYHVQTEDKGLQSPVILSLVYAGGAILASKRSPYDDLIAGGFTVEALAERLQRQHKLICAAVHAGRIEELKQLGDRDNAKQSAPPRPQEVDTEAGTENEAAERFAVTEESEEGLSITLIDEKELRAGASVTLRIKVSKTTSEGRTPAAKASITVKILGSNFQPASTFSTTDSTGRSSISIALPMFKAGRAAILIRAEADGEVAELRRIIQPA